MLPSGSKLLFMDRDDPKYKAAEDILTERWARRLDIARDELCARNLTDIERAVVEQKVTIYEMILHEFKTRFALNQR
jgi:hypothetical protein